MDTQTDFDCQTCGACCSFSADWPRFSTESDAELDLIPLKYVAADEAGMRCEGNRCSALVGEIRSKTSCAIYAVRPHVCRTCSPGDFECLSAREFFGIGN
ncbi:YkgJ family cysteine cluster protein [Rhizobium sp. BE258]|jgi:Fe-S-cluster containining protein|uniref:YkgJ family cysteine cluster protein n=1 Tax=unclassified Rhizobium TaxID=2613769 RepID=UPI000DDC2AC5|nr:YkgJ family cysteine cluster protein [Rhizobium sp. BE258]MDR7142429.1 Fe-S-cluster containining protein [Rhizobium sp. BE258]